jgi:RNA polymerase sigma factor (sigma-70 family)
MDLMQAGTLGLIKAVDNFDVLRGTRLSTYAVPHIRAEIIKYLDSNKSIRVPQAVARRHYRLQETFEELKREEGPLQGASVSEEELAAATGIAPAHVRDWLVCGRRDTLSLDAPITDTGMTLADVIEDEGSSGEQEREYTRMELSNQLGDALGKLTKKELKFVQMRYGADASMSYISKTLKISPKRLKKLEAAVLLKLRETMKNVI